MPPFLISICYGDIRQGPWLRGQALPRTHQTQSLHAILQQYPSQHAVRPNRTMFYKAVKVYALLYLIGLFRKPYVKAHILSKQEAEQQVQEEEVSSLLSKIDIKLADYP